MKKLINMRLEKVTTVTLLAMKTLECRIIYIFKTKMLDSTSCVRWRRSVPWIARKLQD